MREPASSSATVGSCSTHYPKKDCLSLHAKKKMVLPPLTPQLMAKTLDCEGTEGASARPPMSQPMANTMCERWRKRGRTLEKSVSESWHHRQEREYMCERGPLLPRVAHGSKSDHQPSTQLSDVTCAHQNSVNATSSAWYRWEDCNGTTSRLSSDYTMRMIMLRNIPNKTVAVQSEAEFR